MLKILITIIFSILKHFEGGATLVVAFYFYKSVTCKYDTRHQGLKY